MSYFTDLLAKVFASHSLLVKIQQTQSEILTELKEFKQMADTNFANLNAEFDKEDAQIGQVEADLTAYQKSNANQLAAVQQQLTDLQNQPAPSVDDTAEIVRLQAEETRLANIDATLQAQIAAQSGAGSTANTNPNTGPVVQTGSDSNTPTATPTPINATATAANPNAGTSTPADPNKDAGAGAGNQTTSTVGS